MNNRYKKYKPPFDERNKAGERICVMCGEPLTGRKQRWCGKRECFQKAFIRAGDQMAMRRWLREREHCICQICGRDCALLYEVIRWLMRNDCNTKLFIDLQKLDIPVRETSGGFVTWEADHIIPLARGGEHHEDNIRTLCISCHRKETNRLVHGHLDSRQMDLISTAENKK